MAFQSDTDRSRSAAVIGGGPAGLMAAEALVRGGARVDLYDAMPSVGRKFLLAGKGGLNLTHAEPTEAFLSRYGERRTQIEPLLGAFGPEALREWALGLGVETFIGTSGRVFPVEKKAAPLLRAWLHRLRAEGVSFHMRHGWRGWDESGALRFATPQGEQLVHADAVVLALGGGSRARLGSDGAWVPLLAQRGVSVAALRPTNCGFDIGWSEHLRTRFAGHPVKPVVASFTDAAGTEFRKQGEFVVTLSGIEGGLIYALSASLRDEIEANVTAVIQLDLAPGWELQRLTDELSRPRGSRSLSSHLQSRVGIKGVKAGLLREVLSAQEFADPVKLAAAIKALPLRLIAPRPLDEAISSAGGVVFEALDRRLMIRDLPGVFCAGEMLDWEAPTGGYLLTACFASGRAAGQGVLAWLEVGAKGK
ncbi:MAG: TIGR03862 family flavoprotein [Sulfuricella sp.]|nr:TIGR03862 family flavoprotein [Sulfuricella sp.]